MLYGPPACGKSTFARAYVEENKNAIIVNRDSIRLSIGETNFEKQKEDFVTDIEVFSVKKGIEHGFDVIIDATNLNPTTVARWEGISKELGCELDRKEFYLPYSIALQMDKKRASEGGASVGEKVLRKFYQKYYYEKYIEEVGIDVRPIRDFDNSLPPCVMVDLDGTLCIHNGRTAFEYDKIPSDKCDHRLKYLIELYIEAGIEVIFLSGREKIGDCEKLTKEWLKKNITSTKRKLSAEVPTYTLVMRECGDHRPDDIVKAELFEKHIEGQFNPICVYDDRDKVVKMWRDRGILCNQVYYGNF